MIRIVSVGIGKGVRERNSPYRQVYVFGTELDQVNLAGLYSPFDILNPTSSFNLSTISKNHEVVCVLINLAIDAPPGPDVLFNWYRDRDNALIFSGSTTIPYSYPFEYSAISWIGWNDWEIKENGGYHVDILVSGLPSILTTRNFNVSGITEEPVPDPVVTGFIPGITWRLATAAEFFYSAWLEVGSWVWPFKLLAPSLYGLAETFDRLVGHFIDFGVWVAATTERATEILSSVDIIALLRTWLDYASDSWSWIRNAWQNVGAITDDWWSSTSLTVRAWIDEAKSTTLTQIASVLTTLMLLKAAWDDFKGKIPALDEVVSWWGNWHGNVIKAVDTWWTGKVLEVQGLIDSGFTRRESLWSGWQDVRAQVLEFFADPEDYLVKKLETMLVRFW